MGRLTREYAGSSYRWEAPLVASVLLSSSLPPFPYRSLPVFVTAHASSHTNPRNVNGIIQGHMDVPLNDAGRKESEKLRDHLADVEFVEAWSSSLSRAREVRRGLGVLETWDLAARLNNTS